MKVEHLSGQVKTFAAMVMTMSLLAGCSQVLIRPDTGSAVTVKPAGDGQLEVGVEGRVGRPEDKPPVPPSPAQSADQETRRAEVEAKIRQLQAACTSLQQEVGSLGMKKEEAVRSLGEADKELVSRKDAVVAAMRKLEELQRAANEMSERNSQATQSAKALSDQITATEAKLATAAAGRQQVEQERDKLIAERNTLAEQVKANSDRLAATQGDLAETTKRQKALADQASDAEQRRAAADAAAAEATTKAERTTAEFRDAQQRIDEAKDRLAAVTRQLADGEREVQRLTTMQQQAARPNAAPVAPVVRDSAPQTAMGSSGWETWPIVGIVVAIIIGAIAAVMYMIRKPIVYTFTLLDENSKASHAIKMTSAERVDLNGAQPVKKVGAGNGRVPFLTIDRKGRLVLHPMAGYPIKLNDRLVNITDAPMVKPGTVLEITGNGQVSRLVVGPVSAVNQDQKPPVKLPAASVRPV